MDINVVETEDNKTVVEYKQNPWIKIVIVGLLAMLLLSLAFIFNTKDNSSQTIEAPTQNISISPSPFEKNPEKIEHVCPTSEYANCMPGPGPKNPQCDNDYLQWAQENCPNFKGAAY